MELAWHIANRFRNGKKTSGYLSFMSFSSVAGISLGCFVLITLLSVMNGFEKELIGKLLSVIPHGEIYSVNQNGIEDWQNFAEVIQQDERVDRVSPFTQITGLLQKKSKLHPLVVTGLAFDAEEIDTIKHAVDVERIQLLKGIPNGIILGQGVANKLELSLGDTVDFLIPKTTDFNRIAAPKKVKLKVIGLLNVGGDIDATMGLINLKTASEYLNIKSGAQGVRITVNDPFIAPQVVRDFGYSFEQPVYLSDWTRTHGHIFQDIQLVRLVVYIVLTLVIAVACFNVVSTMVMEVKARQTSIAILISMGATPALIKRIFLIQGMLSGLMGVAIGTASALIIVPQLSYIIATMERVLNISVLSSEVYFINFLPTDMQWMDVLITVGIGLGLSVIAAYYPAKRAASVKPAQALG